MLQTDNPENRTVKLKDGRVLGYAEYGDPKGKPLLYFHGWPSSRFSGNRVDKAAKRLHVRVISVDRPGYGLSDYQPNRKLLDFPNDVSELADILKIHKLAILGVSGGGPYAAAVAYALGKRITAAGIAVGLAPTYIPDICDGMAWTNKVSWTNYHRSVFLRYAAACSIWAQAKIIRADLTSLFLSSADKQLRNDSFKKTMQRDRLESIRQGAKGAALDLELYTKNWGFELKEIRVPVFLWYGENDKNVSLAMGKYYASQIPKSKLTVFPGGGHFSWWVHAEEVVKTLTD